MSPTLNLTVTLLSILIALGAAHSNVGSPLPYSKTACKGDRSYCDKPCPPVWSNARNSPENPAAEWRRGQKVTITWHKNNHIGGFYRRSLVPVRHMNDWDWHQKTAFEWGCWGQGTFKCGQSPLCGGDKQGRAYRNDITVPGVFPDGDYVFAQVWYGGIHWRGQRPKYADYYSCSFIRIRGGAMKPNYKPSFRPNPNPGKRPRQLGKFPADVCATGSTRLRECGGDACEHKNVRYTVPDEFAGAKSPNLILASLFGHEVSSDDDVPESDFDMTMQKDAMEENREDSREDAEAAAEEMRETQRATHRKAGHSEHASPIRAVRVAVPDGEAIELKNGGWAKVQLGSRHKLRLDVLVYDGANIRSVELKEPTSIRAVQRYAPYTFRLSRPARDEWIPVTFQVESHRFKIHLYFPTRNLVTKKGATTATGDCSPDNIPPAPVGAWDDKYSAKWWFNRNRFVARREYCRRCNLDCR